jgi:predicted dehydrogenase
MVKNGAIGDLVSANCYYNTGSTRHIRREAGWSDMEAMLRNKHMWRWVTGDVIVNLMIHQIDILNWFFEKYPEKLPALVAGTVCRKATCMIFLVWIMFLMTRGIIKVCVV